MLHRFTLQCSFCNDSIHGLAVSRLRVATNPCDVVLCKVKVFGALFSNCHGYFVVFVQNSSVYVFNLFTPFWLFE